MATIKPLDHEAVIKAARETGAIMTIEDHTILGGLGSAVAEVLVEMSRFRCRGLVFRISLVNQVIRNCSTVTTEWMWTPSWQRQKELYSQGRNSRETGNHLKVTVPHPPKSGMMRTITCFTMHRNGENTVSRRVTRDFRAEMRTKAPRRRLPVNSNY